MRADLTAQYQKCAADVQSSILQLEEMRRDSIDPADRDTIQHLINSKRQDLKHSANMRAFHLKRASDVQSSIRRLEERRLDSIDRADRFKIEYRIAELRQDLEHIRLSAAEFGGELETSPDWILRAPEPPVVLAGPDADVIVCGKRKDPLPPAQYRVIKVLVEAKANGERLTIDALRNRTKDEHGNGVEDPLGALNRLCKHDSDWKLVIDMAGVPGRGYSLKDCHYPPTKT
jgi:hypothetical protein